MSRKYPRWFFAAGLILLLAAGIASAAIVPQNISFSGNLTNAAGTPLTGKYTVTFRLYNVATGGTALGTDTHAITAYKGNYTTWLSFPATRFNGQALWVGVQRPPDIEMRYRTILYPVPYALGLRPGAVIAGSGTAPVINVSNSAGVAVFASGREGGYFATTVAGTLQKSLAAVRVVAGKDRNTGVGVTTTGQDSTGVNISASGPRTRALTITTNNNFSPGIWVDTKGPVSMGIVSYAYGSGSYGIISYSMDRTAIVAEGREGGFFTTNQPGNATNWNPGVNISTRYPYNPGLMVRTTGAGSYGIHVETVQDDGIGILSATGGSNTPAVFAYANGSGSTALLAHSDKHYGIMGSSRTQAGIYGMGPEGGFFTTSDPGNEVHPNAGVNISTIYDYSPGLTVRSTGFSSRGISAFSAKEYGVYGEGVIMAGVRGQSNTAGGVYGRSLNEYGVYGVTDRADHRYGVYTPDYLYAKGTQVPAADVAEYMPVSEDLPPGTVVIIGDDGKLRRSAGAYDTNVAGIISTDPGVTLGTKENGNFGEAQIAVAGRVPCNVDATTAPIHPGNLLTTSDRPGYAMKATDPKIGTILGKAMGSLETGTGTIEVLVTLQ